MNLVVLPLAWIDLARFTGPLALLDLVIVVITLFWVLAIKREPTSAIAWCLLVIVVPLFGALFFFVFGYQSVHRPLARRRRSGSGRVKNTPKLSDERGYEGLAELAVRLGADPLTTGNHVEIYHTGAEAFDAMLAAIRGAQRSIHMEFFIARADESGVRFMEALAEKARAGVQVRFLYDAVGSWSLRSRVLRILTDAGGQAEPFLTLLNPLRRRLQVNLRNHRKILVVDGQWGFTGGLNLGDEYLGRSPFFGPWRDVFMRVEGPAVASLQKVFAEDWEFAAEEVLPLDAVPSSAGTDHVQVLWSGPDQDIKTIREVYFAAIMRARQRVWLVTPYFVPDSALLDALCLAARSGRDVRVLCPFRPDKWVPHLASRYYWADLLRAGVNVYQYTAGFLHEKLLLIDDDWSSVGTANFDNRSLLLNFEVTCVIESPAVCRNLREGFQRDCEQAVRIDAAVFSGRPFVARMAENVCRLLSPIL